MSRIDQFVVSRVNMSEDIKGMDDTRYKSICSELDLFINWGVNISNALSNKEAPMDRDYYGDRVFSKLLCHAITLRRIIPTGLIPEQNGQTELWDISSACAITRALIESFDALFYVAIEEVEDNEREFRILLWNLHSEERRLKKLDFIGSKAPEIIDIKNNVKELRKRVIEHKYFHELNKGIKKKIEKGETPAFCLSHSERNMRAFINHSYYNACIMFLSAYVHTYPFSINQLMEFKAGDAESLRLMSVPIQYALGFLAKSMEGMHVIFKDRLPNMPDNVSDLCSIWSGVIENGIQKIG